METLKGEGLAKPKPELQSSTHINISRHTNPTKHQRMGSNVANIWYLGQYTRVKFGGEEVKKEQ